MPLWQVIAIVVTVWLLAAAGIVVFMMGASRGRRMERLEQERHGFHGPLPADRLGRRVREDLP